MAEFSVNPSKDIPSTAENGGEDSASFDKDLEQREWSKTLETLNPLLPVAQVIGAINFMAQSVFGDSPAPAPAPAPAPKPTTTSTQIADRAMGGYDMSKQFQGAGITNAPTHTNFAKE